MKMYKLVFINSLIFGTLISVSSQSWFSMWMGLEINLLSIIPLLSLNTPQSTESSMKYFIVQATASAILLMAALMSLMQNELFSPQSSSFSMMMNSALMTKMGMAPFHFWFPEVMEGLTWNNALIMLTWQKIAPMMLIMNNPMHSKFIIIVIVISLTISMIMIMNQISLRKILTFSSINHMAWMMAAMTISYSLWTIYFITYSLTNWVITMTFSKTNSFYLSQLANSLTKSKMMKMAVAMNFLSLGGLPPFIGFLPKWLVINQLESSNMQILSVMMIISTMVILFVYIRVISTSILIVHNEPKMKISLKSMQLIAAVTLLSLTALVLVTMTFNFN